MLSTFAISLLALAVVKAAPADCASSQVSAAWYAGWASQDLTPLNNIDMSKYNTMYYSFAETTSDVSVLDLSASNGGLLSQFVPQVHSDGAKAHIAIGGWTGSGYFSDHFATANNRTAFANTVSNFVTQNSLDGVQFAWEYPNDAGAGCNSYNADDTANYLLFLQELRQSMKDHTISLAVPLAPFKDASGNPSQDVSAFAEVVDYVTLMNWDVFTPSTSATVGPNAPLDDSCALPQDRIGSAISGVTAWSQAGIESHQIVLGVASYGHSYDVPVSDAFLPGTHSLDTHAQIIKPSTKRSGTCDLALIANDEPTFADLVADNTLDTQGLPAPGIDYAQDGCSQTPYVYSETAQVMVSYDDANSFAVKGQYIQDAQLGGFAMWHASGDYNNILLDAISNAVGPEVGGG